ncbi:response regulator [Acidithrix sp. C25]|uniref:Putative transcriptional regulatory protein pdtaR n=2 Tax=Acidithrix ferrooxidans TaxID=1280514 RepID=A0A0D8HGW8_9ACTN|nr:response regulator [Acidithrix sp. C25]KJF17089.1 putative transcriptional regulatory protein pdtaR [Acidithrix ferrooxidans]
MARVVIAEDEAIIRLDLKEALEELGYEVVGAASTGDEGLEMIRSLKPDFAILDIKMPGLDGLQVAHEVGEDKICPVIILTAFSQRALIEQARDAGALAYLVKPFQPADLVPAIEIAIARFAQARALEEEIAALSDRSDSLSAQLELRKLLDRAKGILMERYDMTEPESFSFIQRSAMDSRARMSEVATKVISGELTPLAQ